MLNFISPKYLSNSKIFALNTVFIMGNKRNRRSRRIESQSSDRDENTSETSFTQGNATLVEVSEQNNHKMTQIEQQLNSKFKEILKGIRTNRESNLANDEEEMPRTIDLALQIQKISI